MTRILTSRITVIGYCLLAIVLASCSDTWDDHYEGTVQGINEGTLWQAIKQNPDLSNFANVLEATGYDKTLASSQVFTVFAPTNACLSSEESARLISEYKEQVGQVSSDDNTVIKEFVRNHIALFNFSASSLSNDSIVLMNGKHIVLGANSIGSSTFDKQNQLYENGVLFTVSDQVRFTPNVFEALRLDSDLDSVRSFFYNPLFYKKEFVAKSSVEGGIDSLGRTVYLDSVFVQKNELYSLVGQIAEEDSTYWMIAPTNAVWTELVEKYSPYFVYNKKVENLLTKGDLDSLAYTNTRLAIMKGTVFSKSVNEDFITRKKTTSAELDSVFSYNAYTNMSMRSMAWGTNFNYYQYFDPLGAKGVLAEKDSIRCSNGQVMKVSDWKLNELQTFNHWIIVQAEGSNSIKEIDKYAYNISEDKKDTTFVDLATYYTRSVANNNFANKVWNSQYVEFVPSTARQYSVTFNITDVLSNMPYDIYLVTTTPLANDSNATATQRLPTIMSCTINHYDVNGLKTSTQLQSSISTTGAGMDYLLLAEGYEFPVATYGLSESQPQVTLTVKNIVTNKQKNGGTHTANMCIDCILLVPHGTLMTYPEEGAVLMSPHGNDLWHYIRPL